MSDAQRTMTWAALLAKWTEFAKSAVALPRDGEGGRLRRAVPALIALQAVTHALTELDRLPESERALGLDRAEVLIKKHRADLAAIWGPETPPASVAEVGGDAQLALEAAAAGDGAQRRGPAPN